MANTTSSQTLIDGSRNLVIKVTNISDGTNEADVVKVDASALGLTTEHKIEKIDYLTNGCAPIIEWDGSTDAAIATLPADNQDCIDFTTIGGCHNNATAPTGDITVTATLDANDSYTIIFHIKK